MKTDEYIDEVNSNTRFVAEKLSNVISIKTRFGHPVGAIYDEEPKRFMHFSNVETTYFDTKFMALTAEYLATPVGERVDVKKWYVKVPKEWSLGTFFTKTFSTSGLSTWGNDLYRTQFTQQEIKEYHLENFENELVEYDKNE